MNAATRDTARSYCVLLAAAVLAAAARAALIAARDGYLEAGLIAVALKSAAHHFLACLPESAATALLFVLVPRRRPLRARASAALGIASAALAYLFVSGRMPDLGLHAPGATGPKALAAHAGGGFTR